MHTVRCSANMYSSLNGHQKARNDYAELISALCYIKIYKLQRITGISKFNRTLKLKCRG